MGYPVVNRVVEVPVVVDGVGMGMRMLGRTCQGAAQLYGSVFVV